MSFSRYSIEKKQVSTDKGVHWEDYTPAETRKGNLVGVARTLLECEDMACDLEKYEYRVISGELPHEVCGAFSIPEGIVKTYSFTAGAVCCHIWITSHLEIYNYLFQRTDTVITGTRICGGGYCPGWGYNTNINNNGMSLRGVCAGYTCYDTEYEVCPCITLDSLMPWAEGKESWQVIEKQHYVRRHCSDPWETDGEPEIIGIGERWKYLYDDFYTETWQHQVASSFDASGNVLTWDNVETPTITYYNSTLPDDFELIDEIRSDNTLLSGDLNLIRQTNLIQCRRGDYSSTTGGTVLSNVSDSHYKLIADNITNSSFAYYGKPRDDGSGFSGFFFDPVMDKYHCNTYPNGNWVFCDYIAGAADVLNGISTGLIRVNDIHSIQDKLGTLYPYRIPEPSIGLDDDYWNGIEYGYVRRDGTSYPLGYVTGYYVDSSGNTNHISVSVEVGTYAAWRRNTPIPSDAVSLTSIMTNIPNSYISDHTSLSSVTLTNTMSIGDYAFAGTTSLHSISFPDSLTTIGGSAFEGSGLSAVTLNNVSTLGAGAFAGCQQLGSINFSSGLTDIPASCFSYDNALTNVVIPGHITTIGTSAFEGCSNLTAVTLSEGVSGFLGWTFRYTGLKEVEIPNTVGYYGYRGAFEGCSDLEKVTINTTATITADTFTGCNIKELIMTTTTPPMLDNGRGYYDGIFSFNHDAVILVPASAVDTYKSNGGNHGWAGYTNMIYPIPNETEWVNVGYACVDGQRYDYEHKRGRNTEYSNDWFWLPEYRTVGEPYGECDGTEPY